MPDTLAGSGERQSGKIAETSGADSPFDEEDDNSDVNLQFLCEKSGLAFAMAHYFMSAGADIIPPGHIVEISTPPPLV